MAAEVIGLYGPYEPDEPRTNQMVVEELERLLEAAKSGDIVGMAGSYLHKDHFVSYSHAGVVHGYGMLGGLDCLKEKLLRMAVERE